MTLYPFTIPGAAWMIFCSFLMYKDYKTPFVSNRKVIYVLYQSSAVIAC